MVDGSPIIAIVRSSRMIDLDSACGALFDGGINTIQLTLTTPGCLEAIGRQRAHSDAGRVIGCGSITDVASAQQAIDSGAQFLVMPVLDPSIIAFAVERKVPSAAGAYTPTEIFTANRLGASMVKVFPADTLGPSYFRSVLAPMPTLKLMPTGGVTLDTLDAWRTAGAVAVGAGSALVKQEWLCPEGFVSLREEAARWTLQAAD